MDTAAAVGVNGESIREARGIVCTHILGQCTLYVVKTRGKIGTVDSIPCVTLRCSPNPSRLVCSIDDWTASRLSSRLDISSFLPFLPHHFLFYFLRFS